MALYRVLIPLCRKHVCATPLWKITTRNMASKIKLGRNFWYYLHERQCRKWSVSVGGKLKGDIYRPKRSFGQGQLKSTAQQRQYLEVEKDPYKLCNYLVGGNIFKEGEHPKLKPDEEYPDWLWTLRLENTPVPLEELEYDSQEYWDRLMELHKIKKKLRHKLKHKCKRF